MSARGARQADKPPPAAQEPGSTHEHGAPLLVPRPRSAAAPRSPRAAQPDLRFHIGAILGDGDLVAVVGTASRRPRPSPAATRLIWLIRLEGGQMAEMWTYRDTSK